MQTIGGSDLRRWEREPVAIPVSLVLKADKLKSDTFTATIDVSLSGVGVRTTLALVPRQGVAIVIKGQFSQTIPARVIWVREDASSNSTIAGLKFLLQNGAMVTYKLEVPLSGGVCPNRAPTLV